MKLFLIPVIVTLFSNPALAAIEAAKAFSVRLQVVKEVIAAGTVPQFELIVTNTSGRDLMVLDLNKRLDWQHALVRLAISEHGKEVITSTSGVIEDPGVLGPSDSLTLYSKQKVVVHLRKFLERWEELQPGEYQANVSYFPSDAEVNGIIHSNEVSFRIAEAPK